MNNEREREEVYVQAAGVQTAMYIVFTMISTDGIFCLSMLFLTV
jgi:3,4-dihydroxy-2-butanone 4-phosphate synthase